MTIAGLPYNDCDCCGYGSEVWIDRLALAPPVILPNCAEPTQCVSAGVVQYWDLVVPSNFFDGCSGARCDIWEGSFVLTYFQACTWRTPQFTAPKLSGGVPCTNVTTSRWTLVINSGSSGFTRLTGPWTAAGFAGWQIANNLFDCLGPNVLTYATAGGGAPDNCIPTGFSYVGTTLTIEPAFGP